MIALQELRANVALVCTKTMYLQLYKSDIVASRSQALVYGLTVIVALWYHLNPSFSPSLLPPFLPCLHANLHAKYNGNRQEDYYDESNY